MNHCDPFTARRRRRRWQLVLEFLKGAFLAFVVIVLAVLILLLLK